MSSHIAVATQEHVIAASPTGDLQEPADTPMAAVRVALAALHLDTYAHAFETAGYDDLDFLVSISPARRMEIAASVGMPSDHAARFADWLQSSVGAVAMTRQP